MNCIDCGHDIDSHYSGGCYAVVNSNGMIDSQVYCRCVWSRSEAKKKSDPELGPVLYTVSKEVWERVINERAKTKKLLDILTLQTVHYVPPEIYKLAKQFQNEIQEADQEFGEIA